MSRPFWTFQTAGEIVFGCGAAGRLGRLTRAMGYGSTLIVTDESLRKAGAVDRVTTALSSADVKSEIFAEGEPEPSIVTAEAAIAAAKRFQPDCVIGLGGGSNMDVAKIVALVTAHGGHPSNYFGPNKVPGPVAPVSCVPTTAGTGSEVSHSAVLTDTENRVKVSTLSKYLRPRLAVVDPELTLTCPAHVTAESGIDALTHAIEAYTVRDNPQLGTTADSAELPTYHGKHPLGDALAERAIALVGQHLVTAVRDPENLAAREGMSLAATLAGMAFSNCGVALVHALEYPIGGATGCAHGAGNGLLLPHVVRFNLPERRESIARVAELLGRDTADLSLDQAAHVAIEAVVELQKAIGIPLTLREFGAKETQLSEWAARTYEIKRLLAINPRKATEQDLLDILRAAL